MTLPQLYRKIVLTSYDETVQYRDNFDDSLWHASPFSMGLMALATRKAAALVEELTVEGDFREHELDLYKNRRLPDSSVLLNISIRGAIDRCVKLESFRWVLVSVIITDD